MRLINHTDKWDDSDGPTIFDLLRIFLGIVLFVKGVEFIRYNHVVTDIIEQSKLTGALPTGAVLLYIVLVHLAGGLGITLGIFTRFFCLLQLPVLAGAVYLTIWPAGQLVLLPYSNSWLVYTVAVLLVFFFLEGSGSWSVYGGFKKQPDTVSEKQ
jgi:uncharacterized membrane protein YphA (DoxX/SURF4 family)